MLDYQGEYNVMSCLNPAGFSLGSTGAVYCWGPVSTSNKVSWLSSKGFLISFSSSPANPRLSFFCSFFFFFFFLFFLPLRAPRGFAAQRRHAGIDFAGAGTHGRQQKSWLQDSESKLSHGLRLYTLFDFECDGASCRQTRQTDQVSRLFSSLPSLNPALRSPRHRDSARQSRV